MVVIYDLNMKKVAYLENAFDIGYEQKYNNIWTASFSMPLDDVKNQYCNPFWFAEIRDEKESVGLFRIMPTTKTHDNNGLVVVYELEHVLATLLDNIMFGYHQIGGLGIYTRQVLEYILSFQSRWILGEVEFDRQFMYSWENENLLSAIFSVVKPFDEEYQWQFDTKQYPWVLHLKKASSEYGAEIRYKRNMESIEIEEDPTNLCTRLYALGYGEGVNQLSIESVNPTGKAYIDADTINQFGIIERVWVDRRYDNAETLYNAAKAALETMKMPRISVNVSSTDLYKITKDPLDKFTLGKLIQVRDEELDLTYRSRVINISKSDIYGDAGSIDITISNETESIASSISDLASRTKVNELYAQGATNLDSYVMSDNCDPENPAKFKFHISEDAVNINQVLLNYEVSAFRAYSKAIEGGGEVISSTESGGGLTDTTGAGGFQYFNQIQTTTSVKAAETFNTLPDNYIFYPGYTGDTTQTSGLHNHGIVNGTRLLKEGGGSVPFIESGDHWHGLYNHGHTIRIGDYTHSHDVNIIFYIPEHVHSIELPNHTHGIEIPNHTHSIEYGIYEGPTPTSVVVKVDGNIVEGINETTGNVNVTQYLGKDEEGKIIRGWHELEIIPDDLGRVEATLHLQLFIQSRGGEKL